MKEIAKMKAKEERKRLESEVRLNLHVIFSLVRDLSFSLLELAIINKYLFKCFAIVGIYQKQPLNLILYCATLSSFFYFLVFTLLDLSSYGALIIREDNR